MRKQLILACAVSLSACATKPVSDTAAVPAPAERVFMYQSAVPDGGTYEKPTNWTLIGDETGHRCQMNWMRAPEALDSAASIHFPDLAV
ncbi:hypothetical protein [Xanthomonas axonopodis]